MSCRLALLLAWCCTACACAQTAAPEDGATPSAQALARRPDERRPEGLLTVSLFGRPAELGLSYEFSAEQRRDFDLNAARQRDRDVHDHELKIDARVRASDSVTLFAQAVALADQRKEMRDGSVRRRQSLERGQTWLLLSGVAGLPLTLQLGRIALIERRSWWWDDDLDAVRLSFASADWRLETGLARELARVSSATAGIEPAAQGLTRWFGNGGYRWAPRQSIEVFWLLATDRSGVPAPGAVFAADTEDRSDPRLCWLGLRASGEWRDDSGHRLSYRADAALLRGRETRTPFTERDDGRLSAGDSSQRRVRGQAWDLGAQWSLPGPARPTLSAGLASGSGGTGNDALDLNFRQTGLQENKGRVGGVKRVRFYGELLDPELSNLRIVSAGFALRWLSNSSAEVLLHRYRQQVATDRLAGSRLTADPLGANPQIGREIDLLVALREWRHVELTLRLSKFFPGAAYAADRRDPAHGVELGATLNF